MTKFNSLKELLDYVPNCLICGKGMVISIEGMFSAVDKSKPRWGSGWDPFKVRLVLEDNVLNTKHKNHKISINPHNNEVIIGNDLVTRIVFNSTKVIKICNTCVFKIITNCDAQNLKNKFPTLTLKKEELSFTKKGGKAIQINSYYELGNSLARTFVYINKKSMPELTIDFSKISNFEHLNRRIDTIITFH
jgi:hypothetical protein